jgi:heme-degrading monooxygenase HmoA
MFARNLSIQLKPNTTPSDFAKTFNADVLPLLRKQKGFRDEITLTHDSKQLNAISLWDSKESADAYETSAYPQVLKAMEKVVEGSPKIRTSDVVQSSYHTTMKNVESASTGTSKNSMEAADGAPATSKIAV